MGWIQPAAKLEILCHEEIRSISGSVFGFESLNTVPKRQKKKKTSLSRLCLYTAVKYTPVFFLKTTIDDLLRQNTWTMPAHISTNQTNQLHF
jgi:hypothetical protein